MCACNLDSFIVNERLFFTFNTDKLKDSNNAMSGACISLLSCTVSLSEDNALIIKPNDALLQELFGDDLVTCN